MSNRFLILLTLPLIFFSCRKDFDNTIITTTYQGPQVIVTANLSGQVIGPEGVGEPGVMVRVSSLVEITDENGFYQFRDADLNARGTYVTASKNGFFLGSDRLYPANGSSNFSTIELLRKDLVGTFAASEGGPIGVDNVKLTFPADAVVDAQNNLYTGEVRVVAQWLNPVADNIQDIMPGGLFGLNSDSREVMMASMGMVAVELQDAEGNMLQVATGKKVKMVIPIEDQLLANAPDEVPLWYFDESLGLWIEDGLAVKEGAAYVGEVSHFTFWNVDVPSGVDLIFISGCVVGADGNGIANKDLRIIAPSNIYTYAYGVTDDAGHFSGYLPAGDLLTFEIYDDCGEIFSFDVGPFDADTDLDCFVIPSSSLVTVSGQVVDCDNAGVDQAIVFAGWGNGSEVVMTDDNGDFSLTLFNCEDVNLNVQGFDLENQQQTQEINTTLDGDENLGQLQACDNPIAEYVNAATNGDLFSYLIVDLGTDSIYIDSFTVENYNRIHAIGINEAHTFTMHFSDMSLGTYTGDDLQIYYSIYEPVSGDYSGAFYCGIPCTDVTLNITLNSGPGGFLEGNYSGIMEGWGSMQNPLVNIPVNGNFRVEIPQ